MKYLASVALALAVAQATPVKRDAPQGIDVSSHQTGIDWNAVKNNGIEFVYIKATEGTDYTSPQFSSQYTGATNAGLIRGSYHFARPDTTSGADQAKYFLSNGGGWSADGITLPGALDIEYNPYGSDKCYGVSADDMVAWVMDFSNTYNSQTGRYPVIYTTTDWWTTCTGNSAAFGANNPLWIARFASSIGDLPAGWGYTTFWQYADSGPNPGDADIFNGDSANLQKFARGG
ncbi:glycoside hydrolase family 25 protein [Boletus edulis BED1]|uniref:N,O-diacetylmuramidase n=1 Tax=Boletus edulis BED1 TaxID=1328754 RepID=A0AAD4GC96_BOLED|nr:glycoside hydrolase family 25 protein [Boletus edulis BED1]